MINADRRKLASCRTTSTTTSSTHRASPVADALLALGDDADLARPALRSLAGRRRVLREKIPCGFELDQFEGQAWLGVVPFHMTNVSPRGVPPLPWMSAFPELNVRTYVRVGGVPGVYFFSLDAANPVAVGDRANDVQPSVLLSGHEGRGVRRMDRLREPPRSTSGACRGVRRHDTVPIGDAQTPGRRHARTLSDRALLPVHRRQIIPLLPSRHPSPTMAAAKRRSADLRQHDGRRGRIHLPAHAAAAPLLEAAGHGGVDTTKGKGKR